MNINKTKKSILLKKKIGLLEKEILSLTHFDNWGWENSAGNRINIKKTGTNLNKDK